MNRERVQSHRLGGEHQETTNETMQYGEKENETYTHMVHDRNENMKTKR